jgi:hypothetical protein
MESEVWLIKSRTNAFPVKGRMSMDDGQDPEFGPHLVGVDIQPVTTFAPGCWPRNR